MLKTYSRRQLSPYTSPIQIAEVGAARAVSVDGSNWEIQHLVAGNFNQSGTASGGKNAPRYTLVATVQGGEVAARPRFGALDTEDVTSAIDELIAAVINAELPFTAIDRFEYWLLDEAEQKPLALLRSCVSAEEMASETEELSAWRVRPEWLAMPAAQLKIEDSDTESGQYVPPVNHRLQKLVEERAGAYPRAEWYDRSKEPGEDFPPCLVSESWTRAEDHDLCQRYIRRLAPRLLMLQGLSRDDRQRLEQAAAENAIDVGRFYALYPEIIDEKLMTSLRVEAKLRLAASSAPV